MIGCQLSAVGSVLKHQVNVPFSAIRSAQSGYGNFETVRLTSVILAAAYVVKRNATQPLGGVT